MTIRLQWRALKDDETAFARVVFKDRLPYDKIRIAGFFLPFNDGVPVTLYNGSTYTIYFGKDVYDRGADRVRPVTFIHELTHVWQGHNSSNSFEYIINSTVAQGRAIAKHGNRNKAYEYDDRAYLQWKKYNVEQQASIVEDWFRSSSGGGNAKDTDPRFTYIFWVIRAGKPGASNVPRYRSVVSGDTLWDIAEEEYGKGRLWPRIYDTNKATVGSNPNLIRPGQRLFIPEPPSL